MKNRYSVGQEVVYINSNGINFGIRTITGAVNIPYSQLGIGYYITPTDTPWFAVPEENFRVVSKESTREGILYEKP